MKKFFNFETKSKLEKEALSIFLKKNDIYYECSGCGCGWHFEIKCDQQEFSLVEQWLQEREHLEWLADRIKNSQEWIPELLLELCELAGLETEYEVADGDDFELVVEKAAEILAVEIY